MNKNHMETAEGKLNFPPEKAHRNVDVELPSGQSFANVPYQEIGNYIRLIADGREDFLILESHDGFFQFYGVGDRFVAEMRVNLPQGDHHTYSFIDPEKEKLLERIRLVTPFGQFTPQEREVLSLELLKIIVQRYYENTSEEEFLKADPRYGYYLNPEL